MSDAVRAAHDLSALVGTPPAGGGTASPRWSLPSRDRRSCASPARSAPWWPPGSPSATSRSGDFDPRQFPIPGAARATASAAPSSAARPTTRRPTASLELREAVRALLRARARARLPASSRCSSPAARGRSSTPSTARSCDPGDRVVYPVPSWNNNHYVPPRRARAACPSRAGPRTASCRTAATLAPALPGRAAPLPQLAAQPDRHRLHRATRCAASARRVLEENARRGARGERPLYLMYDQVYWMLCFGGTAHVTPPELRPGDGALHRLRGRDQQGVRGHRRARRLGGGPGGRDGAHVGDPRPRGRVGAAGGAGRRPRRSSTTPTAIRAYQARFKRGVAGAARPAARRPPGPARGGPAGGRASRPWARST